MINQGHNRGAFCKEGALYFTKRHVALTAILLCFGCKQNSKNELILKATGEIAMQLQFQPARTWMGWIDSAHGKSGSFYFADLTTHKTVIFLNEKGTAIDSIPVTVAPRWKDRLKGLVVYNRDTLAAASEYDNNHLYFFNHDGYVFRDVNLPVRFHDTLYEALGDGMKVSLQGDRLFFSNNLIENPAFADTSLTKRAYLSRYDKVWNAMPVTLLYESSMKKSPSVVFIGTGLRERFTPDGYFSLGSDVDCATGNSYYYATANADSIYKFSVGTTTALEKAAPVRSVFASSKTMPYKRTEAPVDGQTTTNREASYRCLKFDKYRHYLYLTFFYPAAQDALPADAGEHRKWSLFIFDEDLNKLAEIPFEKDTYDPNDFVINPTGLFLRKTDHENAQKAIFTLFEVLPAK